MQKCSQIHNAIKQKQWITCGIAKSTNGYPDVFSSEKSTAFSEGDNSKAILDERNLAFVHVKNDFLNPLRMDAKYRAVFRPHLLYQSMGLIVGRYLL